ncbi:MAG: septal ring lytic transglycosylase RlpA family protein [Acidobacteria bacterium]|nr:septal ring lytic transglycosylase RlpA family protein [Acidobacteriota bacterium]
MKWNRIAIFLILTLLEACYQAPRGPESGPAVSSVPTGKLIRYESGLASWYGKDFDGKPTASGEIYDMYKISAAHKTLPLGTHVLVKNEKNGRTLDVVINDRGPFVHGRIIDLSYAAARKLGSVEDGVVPVTLYLYKQVTEHCFSVQVGAFSVAGNARAFALKLTRISGETARVVERGNYYKVLLGHFPDEKSARAFGRSLNLDFFLVSCH